MAIQFPDSWLDGEEADWPEFSAARYGAALSEISRAVRAYLATEHDRAIVAHTPEEMLAALGRVGRAGSPEAVLRDYVGLHLATAPRLTARGYVGRQFSSVLPAAAALDALTAMAPQPASFFEVGPLPNAADKLIQREFQALLGWPEEAGRMVTTTGGSLANLTALLAARNSRVVGSWKTGLAASGRRPAVALGADAHYSLDRAIGVLGLGTDQIVRLPLDARRRICPEGARRALDRARAEGLEVFCLVASAGSTSTGAIDPLADLAQLCAERGIWCHVDGAHAGAFLVSDRLRPRLAGIERVDSFCIDAHKTLFVPASCTLLFYRDRQAAGAAFAQKAAYVFSDPGGEIDAFESGGVNFECTKRPAILNLWLVWAMYGRGLFERKLDHLVQMTALAAAMLRSQPDFTVHNDPDANILCFSHCPPGLPPAGCGAFQTDLHAALLRDGRFFLSKTVLDGEPVLRLVVMNHALTRADLAALIDGIRRIAAQQISPPPLSLAI
ncbi:diaminobutyrate decarboxylase [Cereibacter changlensis]|uniref:Diaminobutyrate decarboxylase n=1 Tax=Cereibacter changlensis TaxID=402884 RepID=A0A4U0Z1K0_9RHOB|nr:pyridoxal-dependent decarboxylase [Cereibacter changlensis]TKA95283.1 diaminobutyrate decarboxylase [Cereibacter changlensis]